MNNQTISTATADDTPTSDTINNNTVTATNEGTVDSKQQQQTEVCLFVNVFLFLFTSFVY